MTPRQRDFSIQYVNNGGDAHKAAIASGYTKTYAKSSAAGVLLKNAHVVAEIKRLRTKMNQMVEKNATDVVNQFSKIAFSDRVGFLKPDPLRPEEFMYKAPDELTQEQRDVVENTKMYTAEIIVIDDAGKPKVSFRQEYVYIFSDKAKALEQMGRHFGIFDDKLKLGISQTNPFSNASPAQLEQLKKSFIKTMNDPKMLTIDAEYKEVKMNGK